MNAKAKRHIIYLSIGLGALLTTLVLITLKALNKI